MTSSSSLLDSCLGGCSTVMDSLKWYMTFLLRPEVLGLTKADISAMITPQLDHLPRLPNGTKGPGYSDAAQFAQGMATHGSSDVGHGVNLQACQPHTPTSCLQCCRRALRVCRRPLRRKTSKLTSQGDILP